MRVKTWINLILLTVLICVNGVLISQQTKMIEHGDLLAKRLESIEVKMEELSRFCNLSLGDIKMTTSEQLKNTQSINNIYENLLAEEKKTRLDSAAMDTSVAELIKQGDSFFAEKKYGEAVKKYKLALSFNAENWEVREKKLLALYYLNPMDSSNYQEILNDCSVLKANCNVTNKVLEIEKAVLLEKGQKF